MAIYDKEKAKAGVEKVFADLTALSKALQSATAEQYDALVAQYNEFPQTFDIDWDLTEHSAEDAGKLAASVREKLTALGASKGVQGANLPHLFNRH